MPLGDKYKYTDKQKRQTQRIYDKYIEQGLSEDEAEERVWAMINKQPLDISDSGARKDKLVDNINAPDDSAARDEELVINPDGHLGEGVDNISGDEDRKEDLKSDSLGGSTQLSDLALNKAGAVVTGKRKRKGKKNAGVGQAASHL